MFCSLPPVQVPVNHESCADFFPDQRGAALTRAAASAQICADAGPRALTEIFKLMSAASYVCVCVLFRCLGNTVSLIVCVLCECVLFCSVALLRGVGGSGDSLFLRSCKCFFLLRWLSCVIVAVFLFNGWARRNWPKACLLC